MALVSFARTALRKEIIRIIKESDSIDRLAEAYVTVEIPTLGKNLDFAVIT